MKKNLLAILAFILAIAILEAMMPKRHSASAPVDKNGYFADTIEKVDGKIFKYRLQ